MSASDAAPLPRAGEVFFDVRGNSRTMRVSWYGDTGIAVFSIWQGGTCTGTFRLPIPELPRMVEALSHGPAGGAGPLQRGSQEAARPAYPESRGVYPGAQAAGQPTAAMGPAAGYSGMPPEDYQDSRQWAAQMDRPSGGYQEAMPGGYGEASPGDYGEVPPGDYRDVPTAGYGTQTGGGPAGAANGYGDAAHGYEDAQHGYESAQHGYDDEQHGYVDASPSYGDAPRGYGDAPRGYGDAPHEYGDAPYGYGDALAEGYQAPPAAGYQPAGSGYGDPLSRSPQPAQGGYAGQAPFQGGPRAPSGPLPVGRWHEGEHTAAYPGADPADGGYGGPEPGYDLEPGYEPDLVAEDMADDPLGGDYGGEAEQGYLPGPPTETFRPVAVGSHSRQAGQQGSYQPSGYRPGGYEPEPADPAEASDYAPYTRTEDSTPESLAYHPGHTGSRDREYRSSRGRS